MKANNIYIQLVMLGTFLVPGLLLAQTVNTGDLYVLQGTQFSTVADFNNTATGTFINDGEAFIYAHFNNDGVVDFDTQGLTRFQGTAVQQLTGGNISYFYNVLFDNDASTTASFELSSEVSIANEAEFNEGIVKNDDFGGLVIFEDNSDHSGVFDGSHVDGHVQKIGDDSFEYPIGDRQLFRYAAISAADNLTDTFTAKYFFENAIGQTLSGETPTATTAEGITVFDNAEFWTITNDSGNSDVILTLSWDETTTPEELVADPQTALRVIRWDENEQQWVDEGGIVDTENKTVTTPTNLNSYGIFTLGRIEDEETPMDNVEIYNVVTPNDDDRNDYFYIEGIENLTNNTMQIFNRWGVKVFETDDYDTYGNVFRGFSEGRVTIDKGEQLPTGTYFYILSYDRVVDGTVKPLQLSGYLYLN